MRLNPLLKGLTSAQSEAVQHGEGPLLILAGPGSGKTRVVTHRIAFLLERGVPASQILALTFTNKAAEEMQSRVARLAPSQPVWVGTYHRFAARLLRRHAPLVGLEANYTIYDAQDATRTLRQTIARLNLESSHLTPNAISSAISWAKNNLITPEAYEARPGHALGSFVARVYPAYQAQLARSNAADFDDLLLHLATLLRENPEVRASLDARYRYVLVDEYQDTNFAQYAIARALSVDYPNLAVTGDPDQSIYGWRGANLKNILEFERDFPEVRVVRLERNYRSTQRILRVAAQLIVHNVKRKEKSLYTKNGEGLPVRLVTYPSQKEEAQEIAAQIAEAVRSGRRRPRDFAVFYRVNALSRAFEFALREHGVPYQMVHGLEFFQRMEIRDVLGYLQLLNNPRDDQALLRTINAPARGIGKTTVGRLSEAAASGGFSLLDAAQRCDAIDAIGKAAKAKVRGFVEMFDALAAVRGAPVEEILGHVLTRSGYQKRLESSAHEEDQQRLANIEELLTVAREFDERYSGEHAMEDFLEETSLVGDTDDWEAENDRATLMTLHASKGLEFPVVYLAAVEQGLLPHERSQESPEQLEEERRLMFVGITRAREELQISMAGYRDFRGQRKMTIPSQFLLELPRDDMQIDDLAGAAPSWAEPYREVPFVPAPLEPAPLGPAPAVAAAKAPLTTAAELANGASLEPPPPDAFHQGMLVRHPEHGLGRVVALSGSGIHRKATVDFASGAGQKKFLIAQSPLQPVKGPPSPRKGRKTKK